MANAYHYWAWDYGGSGDWYEGYFYDNANYSTGYQTSATSGVSEDGGHWWYYIDFQYSGTYSNSLDGYNYVYAYHDAESGATLTPYYYGSGSYSGFNSSTPINSASEYISTQNGGYDYFGSNYYEADYNTGGGATKAYHYWAWDYGGSGDWYEGYFYDNANYSTGYQTGATSGVTEDGGHWWYYVDFQYSGTYSSSLDGYNYVTAYHDAESGTSLSAYYSSHGSYSGYSASSPINSVGDYVLGIQGYSYFGSNYYEADYFHT